MFRFIKSPCLFPPTVRHVSATFHPELWSIVQPDEAKACRSLLGRAVPRRLSEFVAGRRCAARALEPSLARGATDIGMIGRRPDRSPIWPAGSVGSITHTGCYAAAAVSGCVRSVGTRFGDPAARRTGGGDRRRGRQRSGDQGSGNSLFRVPPAGSYGAVFREGKLVQVPVSRGVRVVRFPAGPSGRCRCRLRFRHHGIDDRPERRVRRGLASAGFGAAGLALRAHGLSARSQNRAAQGGHAMRRPRSLMAGTDNKPPDVASVRRTVSPIGDHGSLRGRHLPPHDGVGNAGLVMSHTRSI